MADYGGTLSGVLGALDVDLYLQERRLRRQPGSPVSGEVDLGALKE